MQIGMKLFRSSVTTKKHERATPVCGRPENHPIQPRLENSPFKIPRGSEEHKPISLKSGHLRSGPLERAADPRTTGEGSAHDRSMVPP